MNHIPIENIFNYLPAAIRRKMNDDDTILSWTLQAYRKLNTGVQYMRNIAFLDIQNHMAALPDDYQGRHKVSILKTNDPSALVSLYECPECEEDREENRDNPCPITHRFFLNSPLYQSNLWTLMNETYARSDDFFCKAPALDCQPLYFVKSTNIYSSIQTGLMALDYYTFLKDEDGRFLLPDEPQVMWEYLGKHVERKYLDERVYSMDGSGIDRARMSSEFRSMRKEVHDSEVSLFNHWRAHNTLSKMRISNMDALISRGIIGTISVMRQHLSTYYAI